MEKMQVNFTKHIIIDYGFEFELAGEAKVYNSIRSVRETVRTLHVHFLSKRIELPHCSFFLLFGDSPFLSREVTFLKKGPK